MRASRRLFTLPTPKKSPPMTALRSGWSAMALTAPSVPAVAKDVSSAPVCERRAMRLMLVPL